LNRQRSVAEVKEADLSPVQLHERKCPKTRARCPHTALLSQYTAVDIKWNPHFVLLLMKLQLCIMVTLLKDTIITNVKYILGLKWQKKGESS
jgi:hypothetical protein